MNKDRKNRKADPVRLFLLAVVIILTGICACLYIQNRIQADKLRTLQSVNISLGEQITQLTKEAEQAEKEGQNTDAQDEIKAASDSDKSEVKSSSSVGSGENKTEVDLTDLENVEAETLVDQSQIDWNNLNQYFQSYEISDQLMKRISGDNRSYKTYCTVPASDLRYLKVLHYDYDGDIRVGELMVNALLEEDMLYVFRQLFDHKYQIEKMYLVDNYDADDDASVNDNNTSCFNFRYATDSTTLSNHATGCAIDINPLQNPYFRIEADGSYSWDNTDADLYIDRTDDPEGRHMITHSDLCYQLFTERGFTWGGDWTGPIDYQHFEKAVY